MTHNYPNNYQVSYTSKRFINPKDLLSCSDNTQYQFFYISFLHFLRTLMNIHHRAFFSFSLFFFFFIFLFFFFIFFFFSIINRWNQSLTSYHGLSQSPSHLHQQSHYEDQKSHQQSHCEDKKSSTLISLQKLNIKYWLCSYQTTHLLPLKSLMLLLRIMQ